jgi:hypothetical protein
MTRSLAFFFLLLTVGFADTLTLRNGTTATGGWLSADADKIQFLTDDRPRTYAKSDVLEVTFGSVTTVPGGSTLPAGSGSPVLPGVPAAAVSTSPPSARAQAPQVIYGPEPEWVGAVYFKDASGSFIPLERRNATYLPVGAGIGYSPNRLYRDYYVIEGPKSSVRLKTDQKMLFVVRLANGVDPRVFPLYPLQTNKRGRGTKIDPKTKTLVTLEVNITRVGASSYGLMPTVALPPGEYAFSPRNSNDAYCFGVDPQ